MRARTFLFRAVTAGWLAAAAFDASAQVATRVTGQLQGPLGPDAFEKFEFTCTGSPTCTGQYTEDYKVASCSNSLVLTSTITITGLALGAQSSLQGTITMASWEYEWEQRTDGSCVIRPGTIGPATFPYTGTWNALTRSGTLRMMVHEYPISGTFTADLASSPPVFPMTVQSNIDAVSASATAAFQPRPQDAGTQQSVFVFALAPADRVRGAADPGVLKVGIAKGPAAKADAPVACVLAQLNAAGQMQAVNSANLSAYLTGVLSAQGASVTILNGVPTPNVAGATFFLGYGSNSTSMINSGVNRAAVTVPGSLVCVPSAPQTGWWWNPLEDGRGFSLEKRGNSLFFAAFLYDVSGRSTWYVSSGPASLEGSYYAGDLLSAAGGQTLGGPYIRFPTLGSVGSITMTFNNESSGTLVWPGGTVPIQRFNIVPNGLTLPAVPGQPESGWWWNEQEAGRGFFLEFQGGWLDIAGYMYDDNGDSVWYLTVGEIGGSAAARTFTGNWWSYANGQTLTGPWRQNQRINANVAPVTITFSGSDTALMTLPGGRTTQLRRHRF